ncbi:MAG TPA: AsmA-like C-terminal region-containing protein [Opitutaceae bacterium]|nr:AsmA-like C-terminal region-containing protein [Opitutaceae bacterium]
MVRRTARLRLLLAAASLAGCALVLAALALLPPVQRSLLRHALARTGAREIDIRAFHATPFGLAAGRIAFVRGPLGVQGDDIVVRFRPWALLRRRLALSQVRARSLVLSVDLSANPGVPPPTGQAPPPAGGPLASAEAAPRSLSAWRAPLQLLVDGVDLQGRLDIRRGSAPVASADWSLSGGGLRPGGQGAFRYRIRAAGQGMPEAKAAVLAGQIDVAENGSAGLGHLGFSGRAQGLADTLAPSLGLRLDFDRPSADDAYRLRMGLDLGGASFSADLKGAGGAPVEGEVRMAHLPAAWADRWLRAANVSAAQGEFNLAWKLSAGPDRVLCAPIELPPDRIQLTRADGRVLPPLWIQAMPEVSVDADSIGLELTRLRIANGHGWAADLTLKGESGLPPVQEVRIDLLELRAGRAGEPAPVLALRLAHPRRFRLADPLQGILSQGPADLATFSVRNLPLAWATRFLPGRTLAGTWACGESVLRTVPGRGLALATTRPWTFEGLRFDEGGKTYFQGRLEVSPESAFGPAGHWIGLRDLQAVDDRGGRLGGHAAFGLKPEDDRSGGGIDVKGYLPHAPGSGGKLGPVRFELAAAAHAIGGVRGELSRLALTVTDSQGLLLLAVNAAQPIRVERTPQTEWLVSSPQPLRFRTGRVELARLNSWLAERNLSVAGVLPAMELQLWFAPRRIRLVAGTPLAVARFHLERGPRVLADQALLRFGTSLDLAFEHHLLPKFSFSGTGTWALTDGLLAEAGSPLARFNGQVILAADEKGFAPKDIRGGLWADLGGFGRQPFLARARLPARGDLNLQIGKSGTRPHALDFAGRIDHVVGRDGKPAPFLDISGHAGGDWNGRVGTFGLALTLASQPRRSDLAFGLKLDLAHLQAANVASRLTGTFVDLDALAQFAGAFSPAPAFRAAPAAAPAARAPAESGPPPRPAAAAASPPPPAALPSAIPAPDGPPWGGLRGHFTLDVKSLRFAPYQVDQLQGRLDLTDDTLALSHCSGEFFGGRWSAESRTVIRPRDPADPAEMTAHVRVERFDAGQAVRLRFPSPAAGFDGRLNLDVTVSSRADRWEDLLSRASGRFELSARDGRVRLVLPRQEMLSSALLIGGTLTFSKEMRALGRLLPQLADMPINELETSGTLDSDGKLELKRVELATPQLRLVGSGDIPNAKVRDLMGQPFEVQASLAAKGDLAVILGGMNLLGAAQQDGFRRMTQLFRVGGEVGQPDFQPFYDLLARAVDASSGTWGLLMRKVQAMAGPRAQPGR